jgi:hypothetical protein
VAADHRRRPRDRRELRHPGHAAAVFYRLVAAQLIENEQNAYKRLSELTAEGRRDDTFPELADRTRTIHEYRSFLSPVGATEWLSRIYRRDHTEGQAVSLYLAVEKNGMVNQFQSWFGDLGVPILALGGYASQSYVDQIVAHVEAQDRPAILLYGGDHDPSGWDIPRDFVERTDCWAKVERVTLTPEQVAEYRLPESIGKETDSRATCFVARFGALVQVELDALDPDVLRGLFQAEIDDFWDESESEAALAREAQERAVLARLARRMS